VRPALEPGLESRLNRRRIGTYKILDSASDRADGQLEPDMT
jgi:hypothetical protein